MVKGSSAQVYWGLKAEERVEAENRKLFKPMAAPDYDNRNVGPLNLVNNRPGSQVNDLSLTYFRVHPGGGSGGGGEGCNERKRERGRIDNWY